MAIKKAITTCEKCKYCKFPRTSDDNNGACKCKIIKYKTIDTSVFGGETPKWCPLRFQHSEDKGNAGEQP